MDESQSAEMVRESSLIFSFLSVDTVYSPSIGKMLH
jgi:hypothetical protein